MESGRGRQGPVLTPPPYIRVFNPVVQGNKFDPCGDYEREWLRELSRIPYMHVDEPWKMSQTRKQEVRCVIGWDYTQPIVDNAQPERQS